MFCDVNGCSIRPFVHAVERERSMASIRRRRERNKRQNKNNEPREKIIREVIDPHDLRATTFKGNPHGDARRREDG